MVGTILAALVIAGVFGVLLVTYARQKEDEEPWVEPRPWRYGEDWEQ